MKHAKPVPRYTSYPTAPHFHGGIDSAVYRNWLRSIDASSSLSLYAHIPFCDTLCWFCGCTTKHTRRYQPVAAYLPFLKSEIAAVASSVPVQARVQTVHWGGGSPTILTVDDILDLAAHICGSFNVSPAAEFSIEIDPRGVGREKIEVLALAGVTRASIGVQDFDSRVQRAINRLQSFEETRDVICQLRSAGIQKVNLDLIYGLPGQTDRSVAATVGRVLELKPDRIAVFGYAHVPWMKRHQMMLDEMALPDAAQRFQHSQLMANIFCDAGYEPIGLDHFARADDSLTQARNNGRLKRNFQGYTNDPADVLLGFGASSIGNMNQGYIQNATPTDKYQRLIAEQGLATVKGYALQPVDKMHAHIIERLICDFGFSCQPVKYSYGNAANRIFQIARNIAHRDQDGLVDWDNDTFRITSKGKPYVRSICAEFDAFLNRGTARHSLAI
jgi:oxygen-independent coproporphyrinogen-3 oxidase